MSRVIGIMLVAIGIFFFVRSRSFAQASVDESVRLTGNGKWGGNGWVRFNTWQNRLVSAAFVVAGVLALAGVVRFDGE